MTKDYYKILGVAQNATKDEIKKAYRALAHKFHPDKGGDGERFKEVNEAYRTLSDDGKRSQYDQFGQVFSAGGGSASGGEGNRQGGFGFSAQGGPASGWEWPGGFKFDFGAEGAPGDFDFTDVFEDFFGGGGLGGSSRARTRGRKGKDIRIEISIQFKESIFGGKEAIGVSKLVHCGHCHGSGGEPGSKERSCQTCQGKGNVQKTQRTFLGPFTQVSTCPECLGSGRRPETLCSECRGQGVVRLTETSEVFIPRGVRDGEILKMTGKGEASISGGAPGDLYIKIRVLSHEIFQRQGDDIVMPLVISLTEAILGATKEVETLDGHIRLKIPEGTQPGDVLRVRGKGAYSASGYGRGDLLIEIKVNIPKKISKKVKEAIEKLREEGL
jgi:molecular chaperone DnaJ